MAFAAQYDVKRDVVILHFRRETTEQTAYEDGSATASLAKQHGCSRVLVDSREVVEQLPAAAIRRLAYGLSAMGFRVGSKMAVVYSKFDAEHNYFQATAGFAGHWVRCFTDEGQALSWLGGS